MKMPFYTRKMAKYLAQFEGKKYDKHNTRTLRKEPTPSVIGSAMSGSNTESPDLLSNEAKDGGQFEEKKMKLLRDMLQAEVARLKKQIDPTPFDSRFGKKYTILLDEEPIVQSEHCKVFKGKHSEYAQNTLAVKILEFGDEIQEKAQSLEFKILKHIGKKHPNIIQTWDVFLCEKSIIVFQEWANRGSLEMYLEKHGPVNEEQMGKWAWQMAKAIDYFGDIGIAHRNICPANVLLAHRDLRVKMTGFSESVIYWNSETSDLMNVSCVPIEKRPFDAPNFQAPEVYGNPETEEYDPVSADVWSFGAVLFHMLTKGYPYDISNQNAAIGPQIEQSIANITNISEECRAFLNDLLKTHIDLRMTVNAIITNPWFKKFK